uniref:SRC proto-onco, non-receptor tyrosine kinase n=1 Tax=Leptobrachium leishanense TaxID=445787 RepID=A0A8C5RAL6_9ANUR
MFTIICYMICRITIFVFKNIFNELFVCSPPEFFQERPASIMIEPLDLSPPDIPEPSFMETLLRYGLFCGAIFQLICILAIIFPGSKAQDVEIDTPETKISEVIRKQRRRGERRVIKGQMPHHNHLNDPSCFLKTITRHLLPSEYLTLRFVQPYTQSRFDRYRASCTRYMFTEQYMYSVSERNAQRFIIGLL